MLNQADRGSNQNKDLVTQPVCHTDQCMYPLIQIITPLVNNSRLQNPLYGNSDGVKIYGTGIVHHQ